jgi:hypothetical protein
VTKVRDRLAVSKQTKHRVHMERFVLKKLNKVEGKEQYRVETSNRFVTLRWILIVWVTIRENIKISAREPEGMV